VLPSQLPRVRVLNNTTTIAENCVPSCTTAKQFHHIDNVRHKTMSYPDQEILPAQETQTMLPSSNSPNRNPTIPDVRRQSIRTLAELCMHSRRP
jgi:hypothetical protein